MVAVLGLTFRALAEDNTVVTLNAVTTNVISQIVGNTGTNNVWTIENGGGVINTGSLLCNNTASASNNMIVVRGSSSRWTNTLGTTIGFSGGSSGARTFNLYITNGAQWTQGGGAGGNFIMGGNGSDSSLLMSNHNVVVEGSGAKLEVIGGWSFNMNGNDSMVMISNGARLHVSAAINIAQGVNQVRNKLIVTGAGSVVSNLGSQFVVGQQGTGCRLEVLDGAKLWITNTANVYMGYASGAASNTVVVVAGNGSEIRSPGWNQVGTDSAKNTQIFITNGGRVFCGNVNTYIGRSGGSSNMLYFSDPGSFWTNVNLGGGQDGMVIGDGNSTNNTLQIYNGAGVWMFGPTRIGYQNGTPTNNSLIVSGAGSFYSNGVNNGENIISVGYNGVQSWLIATNGGVVNIYGQAGGANRGLRIGDSTGSRGNGLITGAGSEVRVETNAGGVWVGNANANTGTGGLIVTNGGTLDCAFIGAGATGAITNNGGIMQWSTNQPNFVGTANKIFFTNATMSYRAILNAPLIMSNGMATTNIVYGGNNTYRIHSATNNAYLSWAFTNNVHATNWANVHLTGTSPRLIITNISVGIGSEFVVTNASSATVLGVVTNSGTTRVIDSKITWEKLFVGDGQYYSDPSTNIFLTNFTHTTAGYFTAGSNDVFQFERSYFNRSTQSNLYEVRNSEFRFINQSGQHTWESPQADAGAAFPNALAISNKFLVGKVVVDVADDLFITNGVVYCDILALDGLAETNSVTGSAGAKLYYSSSNAANAYLLGGTYGIITPYPAGGGGGGGDGVGGSKYRRLPSKYLRKGKYAP